MIDTLLSLIGYSGSDIVITYICVSIAGTLIIALGYRLFDFFLSFISGLMSRNDKINFR